ncbi:hypothetical protein [Pseudomonas phoenicis]|uniref:hypothetical protein n=1 Tax=unclassified Pseudomonas TaxID=196821 RepID=UPI0039A0E3E6
MGQELIRYFLASFFAKHAGLSDVRAVEEAYDKGGHWQKRKPAMRNRNPYLLQHIDVEGAVLALAASRLPGRDSSMTAENQQWIWPIHICREKGSTAASPRPPRIVVNAPPD